MDSHLLVFIAVCLAAANYVNGKAAREDATLSAAFALGQAVGGARTRAAFDAAAPPKDARKAAEASKTKFASVGDRGDDCRRQIADRVYGKLRAVGFLAEKPILAQIASEDLREKMCRVHAAEAQTLCLLPEPQQQPQQQPSDAPILRLVSTLCDAHNDTLRRHAQCLADVGAKLEAQCAFACRHQFRGAPLSARGAPQDVDGAPTAAAAADALCRVSLCAVRCVGAQLNECEDEANELVDGREGGTLAALNERVSALQMLLGVESVANDAANALVGRGKLPRKCQLFLQKIDDDKPVIF